VLTEHQYPNGLAGDYTRDCIDILHACGVDTAVTAVVGANDARTAPLELKRHGVGGDVTFDEFRILVHGAVADDRR